MSTARTHVVVDTPQRLSFLKGLATRCIGALQRGELPDDFQVSLTHVNGEVRVSLWSTPPELMPATVPPRAPAAPRQLTGKGRARR